MTARRDLAEIICDGPGFNYECPDSAARFDYGTAERVRQGLHEDGWSVALLGGRDRCPKCIELLADFLAREKANRAAGPNAGGER